MPHATDSREVGHEDTDFDNVIRQLNGAFGEENASFDFMARELDPGEKADDAVDYEDFDDDELPEEESETAALKTAAVARGEEKTEDLADETDNLFGENENVGKQAGGAQATDDGLGDLFGDLGDEAPREQQGQRGDHSKDLFSEDDEQPSYLAPAVQPLASGPSDAMEIDADEESAQEDMEAMDIEESMDPATLRAWKLQQSLFAMSSYRPDNPPTPPENVEELLHSLFPDFDRNELPRFLDILPHRRAFFVGKLPPKPPKPVLPTKVNIELAQDQERSFNTGGQGHKRPFEQDHLGIVPVTELLGGEEEEEEEEEDIKEDFKWDVDSNETLPGGITAEDIQVACANWEIQSDVSGSVEEVAEEPAEEPAEENTDDDWLAGTIPPAKRRKVGPSPMDIIALPHIDIPLLDDPEEATSRVAKKVALDMNDPQLALDKRNPELGIQGPKALGALGGEEMDAVTTRRLNQRYNISNDQAYGMLKQNHQNKVRSTLGNMTLEHSMPALRLQWPYYKTELAKAEARSFHRPALSFRAGQTCWFKDPAHVKRKHHKGNDIRRIYQSTKDLSMADNSSVLLLENSEEVPTSLSNFGMANRFINYYRRKNMEDPIRPKAEIGETAVLLPQDKGPFSIFGHVDPGEITPTISNSMYRAPLFHHQAKSTDFLVVRSSTGSGGSDYFLRNIENLYIVGQQFPSVDVPGPHSRKVTTVAKNRMKMLVYRLLKKSPDLRLSISDVTAHIPGTTDM